MQCRVEKVVRTLEMCVCKYGMYSGERRNSHYVLEMQASEAPSQRAAMRVGALGALPSAQQRTTTVSPGLA